MTELTSRRALLAKLTGVLVRQRAVLFVSGVMLTAAAVTAAAIGLSLWANVMILPVAVKLPVLIAVGAGTLYLFGRYAVARLFSGSIDAVAVALEERNPELKGRLIAAIQFARMKDAGCYSA
nr:hypothetical protein [candidate division Zixibacteria bacterium]